ncbi:MAG: hypothetical protein HW419_3662 [Deltaproteobacteria bacterium]|nr:hypothetical protein [Deltaproteobacteria bacterium]
MPTTAEQLNLRGRVSNPPHVKFFFAPFALFAVKFPNPKEGRSRQLLHYDPCTLWG